MHVHIIAVGAYARDETQHFTTESDLGIAFATLFLSSYCAWLLLDVVVARFDVHEASLLEHLSSSGATLSEALTKMDVDQPLANLPTHINQRLGR